MYFAIAEATWLWQGSRKPRIVKEFCKPGKVTEFEYGQGNVVYDVIFFASFLIVYEFIFACNMYTELT